MKNIIALTKTGWSHVQLDNVTSLQKEWNYENKEYRVDVFFWNIKR